MLDQYTLYIYMYIYMHIYFEIYLINICISPYHEHHIVEFLYLNFDDYYQLPRLFTL